MLEAKSIGVALPRRVVFASGRVNEEQAGRDAEAETGLRRPQAPVDVSEMEAIECVGVERYRLQYFPPRRQEQAVEHLDVSGDGAVIEKIDLPLRIVGEAMRDPASQVGMAAPAYGRSLGARAADDAEHVERAQMVEQARGEIVGQNIDIVVRQDDHIGDALV